MEPKLSARSDEKKKKKRHWLPRNISVFACILFILAVVMVLNVCVSFDMLSTESIRERLREQIALSPAPAIFIHSNDKVPKAPRYLNNTGHPPCDWYTPPNLDMYHDSDFRLFHSAPLYVLVQILSEGLREYRDWWFDRGTLLGIYRNGLIISDDANVDVWVRDLKNAETMLLDYQKNGLYDFVVQRNADQSSVVRLKRCDFKEVRADVFSHETRFVDPNNTIWLDSVRNHDFLYDGCICEYNFLGVGIPVLNRIETKNRNEGYERYADVRSKKTQLLLGGACPFLKKTNKKQ